jgi:hypothetical protein
MKITPKILSIPPYISTSWTQIRTLYMQENNLVICLANGTTIAIPNLNAQEIETIFAAHTHFMNTPAPAPQQQAGSFLHEGIASMHLNLDNMETITSVMHHNPEQAHMPNLPKEILKKIAGIAKIIAPGEIQNMPKPEPHCNCPHCQIAKAIHEVENEKAEIPLQQEEEIVNDKDLAFQQWEILQIEHNLYSVTNRLDTSEKYNVFLGEPVGCTCGVPGCEHILAVLKS